jgi:hypothetical protein
MREDEKSRKPSMGCREILRRICADAGRPESSPFCKEVARHLESCGACRDQATSLRGTIELYRCLGGEDVPGDVALKLREALGLPSDATGADGT